MATFPSVDLSKFELPKLDLSKMPKFELPKFELPTFELPRFEMPRFEMPDVEIPEIPEVDVDRIAGLARDAAYVGIGLAVLSVQQAQVRRREAQASFDKAQQVVGERVRALVDAVR
jgi:hypothetical protein